ncbi:MAG: cytochrome c maturation protein CcmE [Pseudomonadota bacterium]
MKTSRKTRRIQMLVIGGAALAGAAGLFGFLAQDAIAFFKSPTELVEQQFAPDQLLRVGGLVVEGTVGKDGTVNLFEITDGNGTVKVAFNGVLPDLFREGQGIVAEGYWRNGQFTASEVLAKHDENYMPKEVADALKEQGHFRPEGDAGS